MSWSGLILLAGVLLAIVAGVVFILFIRMLTGEGRGRQDSEDTRMIQELHQGLTRMEKRIESLETILMEREKKVEDLNESIR